MNKRLQEIIEYKTGGKRKQFSELLGWSPQYLAKLLDGVNFGLKPVVSLLTEFPEIDARWLLLGEGTMLPQSSISGIRQEIISRVDSLLALERFLPYMSPEEIHEFKSAIKENRRPDFPSDAFERWEKKAEESLERQRAINERVTESMKKSIK